jgi:hypothetical protein
MKFPYYKIKEGVIRPIIEIELFCNDKKLRYFALIDSGADMNIFHAEIAVALGIDIEKGKKRN